MKYKYEKKEEEGNVMVIYRNKIVVRKKDVSDTISKDSMTGTFDPSGIIKELDALKKNKKLIEELKNHNNSVMGKKNIICGHEAKRFIITED